MYRTTQDLDKRASRFFSWRQLFHVGETWEALQQRRAAPPNVPQQEDTWAAYASLAGELLDPLCEKFGRIEVTYGFASPELTKHIPGRICPSIDQHAGAEMRGDVPICSRGGAAVDFMAHGSSLDVLHWIAERLTFDRIYYYGPDRPLHLTWAAVPTGSVIHMQRGPSGRLIPQKWTRPRPATRGRR